MRINHLDFKCISFKIYSQYKYTTLNNLRSDLSIFIQQTDVKMDGEKVRITNLRKSRNRRFNIDSSQFEMYFNPNTFEIDNQSEISRENLLSRYNECFDEMLNFVDTNLEIKSRDLIGIKFQIPSMENVSPFGMRFLERQEVSSEMVSDLLMSVQQSNDKFEDKNLLEINCTVIHLETGGGRVSIKQLTTLDEIYKVKKRSIIQIPNEELFDDEKCLPRALIVAQKWIEYKEDRVKLQLLFRNNHKLLRKLTDDLILKTFGKMNNFQKSQSGAVLADLIKFGKTMKQYQITVYDDKNLHTQAVYSSRRKKRKIYLYFLTEEKHFIVIKNVRALFSARTHCERCDVISLSSTHKCTQVCNKFTKLN